jgi:hypothetical protein
MIRLKWEEIESECDGGGGSPDCVSKAKVPGGWLVSSWSSDGGSGITFVPDLGHKWDGKNLD